MLSKEYSGNTDIIRFDPSQPRMVRVVDPFDLKHQRAGRQDVIHRSREQTFAFDHIFTRESVGDIYALCARDIINDTVDGFKGCIFAYGATGSGKTFTMMGAEEFKGMNETCLESIFEKVAIDKEFTYKMTASFVEIYNEYIIDLLKPKNKDYLELWDDPAQGTIVAGVKEMEITNISEMMRLLRQANSRRTTESTKANETSSRSHAILQVNISKKPRTAGWEFEQKVGRLSMIDLAGSERGSVTENRGLRLFEGAKINRSLLALANCINALGDKARKGTFVPYRDSKLTRLLKDSLGGRSRTLMLCAIAPGSLAFEETLNTLKYANRAKEIKVSMEENKKIVNMHVADYKGIIEDLRKEIEDLNKMSRGISTAAAGTYTSCPYCEVSAEAEKQIETVKELLDEQMQLRKQVCEIKAVNKQNLLEIAKVKVSPSALASTQQMIGLEKSVDMNTTMRLTNEQQIGQISSQIDTLLGEIKAKLHSKDSLKILEQVIQLKMTEIENIELENNLRFYEELNRRMMEEYRDLKSQISAGGDLRQSEVPSLKEDLNPHSNPSRCKKSMEAIQEREEELNNLEATLKVSDSEDDEKVYDVDETNKEVEAMKELMQASGLIAPEKGCLGEEEETEELEKVLPAKDLFEQLDEKDSLEAIQEEDNLENPPKQQSPQKVISSKALAREISPSVKQKPSSLAMSVEVGEISGKERNQDVLQGDMQKQIDLLTTVDKNLLAFPVSRLEETYKRQSTIRGDKQKKEIGWNLSIGWGEEFRLYQGAFFPETCALFEGELTLNERDFETLLDPSELTLLQEIELGDNPDEF